MQWPGSESAERGGPCQAIDTLAPAVNQKLAEVRPEQASVEELLAVLGTESLARAAVRWRDVARSLGASNHECDRMASAFEHDDLSAAIQA